LASERVQRRFRVSGRVQGVGFRWWVSEEARALGLDGSVRNSPDGTVEVALGGDPGIVDQLALQLQRGPSGARVEAVAELPPPTRPLPHPFEVAG
jgi:acylphosphatase